MEGLYGGLTNDTCQSHKATAGSHNAPSFSRAKFIEQFKEHLNQRKWTQSPLFPEQNLLNNLKNIQTKEN